MAACCNCSVLPVQPGESCSDLLHALEKVKKQVLLSARAQFPPTVSLSESAMQCLPVKDRWYLTTTSRSLTWHSSTYRNSQSLQHRWKPRCQRVCAWASQDERYRQ